MDGEAVSYEWGFLIGGFKNIQVYSNIDIDSSLTSAEIHEKERDSGVRNSDVVFIATLTPGQRIVSTCDARFRQIFWNENGELKYNVMTNDEWTKFNDPNAEALEEEL